MALIAIKIISIQSKKKTKIYQFLQKPFIAVTFSAKLWVWKMSQTLFLHCFQLRKTFAGTKTYNYAFQHYLSIFVTISYSSLLLKTKTTNNPSFVQRFSWKGFSEIVQFVILIVSCNSPVILSHQNYHLSLPFKFTIFFLILIF